MRNDSESRRYHRKPAGVSDQIAKLDLMPGGTLLGKSLLLRLPSGTFELSDDVGSDLV
jgi:hypothetical protein